MLRVASLKTVLGSCLVLALTAALAWGDAVETKPAKKHTKKPEAAAAKSAPAPAKENKDAKKAAPPAAEAKKAEPAKTEKKEEPKEATKEPKKEASAESKPATYRVKKVPFRIELTLEGTFEAQKSFEVSVRPREWVMFSVVKAAEHGTQVRRGDLLVAFDTEKIDRAITDLRTEIQLSDISLKQAERSLQAFERSLPLDKASTERAQRIATEDLKQYLEIEKPLMAKLTEWQFKYAQESLENQEEEYRQLEKMYKADDLMEDTEKIVIRRAKNAVERAKLNVEFAKASYEESRKHSLPRQEERMKDMTERALIDVQRAKEVLPLTADKQRLDMEKMKIMAKVAEERLNKLLADRELMNVKAPADGVLYYGRCSRGKWAVGPMAVDVLRYGMNVMPNDVFMTVVQERPIGIRANVPESQMENVYPGLKFVVEPTGFRTTKLQAVARSISGTPLGSSFDAQFTLTEVPADYIVAGMTCEMKTMPWVKTEALAIPPKAVFTEELDLTKQYVYVLGKNGKPEKRTVVAGKRNDKQIDVLKGIAIGDQVLLEKPKEE